LRKVYRSSGHRLTGGPRSTPLLGIPYLEQVIEPPRVLAFVILCPKPNFIACLDALRIARLRRLNALLGC